MKLSAKKIRRRIKGIVPPIPKKWIKSIAKKCLRLQKKELDSWVFWKGRDCKVSYVAKELTISWDEKSWYIISKYRP